jgi:hypothetical protein
LHIRHQVCAGVAAALIAIAGVGAAQPTAVLAPISLICAPGKITWLLGAGPPRTPVLVWWQGRVVSGGSISPAGLWALPLTVGKERPGIYAVEVRARGERAILGAFQCAVGVVAPTAAPAQVAPTAPIAPTQAIISVTQPTGECATNAPAPVEGAQAWVTDPAPTRNTDEIACVRLIVNGQLVPRAPVAITVHYRTTKSDYAGTTQDDGVAPITFDISHATIGYTVVIDASVGGQSAQTSFTTQ